MLTSSVPELILVEFVYRRSNNVGGDLLIMIINLVAVVMY